MPVCYITICILSPSKDSTSCSHRTEFALLKIPKFNRYLVVANIGLS